MEFIDAFLLATAFAYFGCLVFTLLEKPPMSKYRVNEKLQMFLYFIAWIIFMYAGLGYAFSLGVYFLLGVAYSLGAMGSFIGWPQKWAAYWQVNPWAGSAAGQIGMAFWDLTIAVIFFMKVTF